MRTLTPVPLGLLRLALAVAVLAGLLARPADAAQPTDIVGHVPPRTASHKADHVRVVVWNIQRGGNHFDDGPEKALAIIEATDADVCLLQESYDIEGDRPTLGQWMADTLNAQGSGQTWTAWQGQSPHLCVLTRLRVAERHTHEPWHGVGATLADGLGRRFVAWSIWLDWRDYLPHALRDHPERTDEQLLASESVGSSRLPQARALLERLGDVGHLDAGVPVLVGGDFNCPSHLDWTRDTALVYRFRRPLPLPVSLAMADAGFADAFRAVHPEPVQHPGITWSPLFRGTLDKPETAERIDRLYTHASTPALRPVGAWTLPGVYEDADVARADRAFPSDHAAVVIDLRWQGPPARGVLADPPRWRAIFQGIDHAELATDDPRPLVVQALRVDLSAAGMELVATPSNGGAPEETDGQTTRAFLEEHGLSVAINTHFFSPCCNRVAGEPKDLKGLAIAQGEPVSPPADEGQTDAIAFTPDLTPRLLASPSGRQRTPADGISHAIAGRVVLRDGVAQAGGDEDGFSTTRHPRTLVGLSEDMATLYLVTIDGRQPGYSTGASLADAAGILRHLGAAHALNVDGGGSTTMVLRDPDGASRLVNRPSGGERVVGSNLGLRAQPLASSARPPAR